MSITIDAETYGDGQFAIFGGVVAFDTGQRVEVGYRWDRYTGDSPQLGITLEVMDELLDVTNNIIRNEIANGVRAGTLEHEGEQGLSSYHVTGYWEPKPLAIRPRERQCSKSTKSLVAAVRAFVEQKQEEGWTKADFAAALKEMLESDSP